MKYDIKKLMSLFINGCGYEKISETDDSIVFDYNGEQGTIKHVNDEIVWTVGDRINKFTYDEFKSVCLYG